jgi:uncharacterized protein (TIGR01777 family)
MKIVVAGGSGFIGEPLVRSLVQRGDDVFVLTRSPSKVNAGRALSWDGAWRDDVANADAVINLAGENVGEGRWTAERKNRIVESRVKTTRALVDAMTRGVLVNASAIGYYGARGDEMLDENAPPGSGFLAAVVKQWEEVAREAESKVRVAILRFGVVLAKEGGALGKMLLPFKLGAGGPIGSGEQWMSWVDRDDVIRMIEWAVDRDGARGVYNVTAPDPVRNRDFARALGRALHRPSFMPAPAFALRLLFGQMADEMLLAGQRVVPIRATAEGFVFRYATLDESVKHALGSPF